MEISVDDLVRNVLCIKARIDAQLHDATGARGQQFEGSRAFTALSGNDFRMTTDDFESALAAYVSSGEAVLRLERRFIRKRLLSVNLMEKATILRRKDSIWDNLKWGLEMVKE